MKDNIEHPGIISKIENNRIWVSIQPQSACGNCQSKSYCGMAEVANKIVEVNHPHTSLKYQPGQDVTITLKKSLGYKALFLGYLLPFLLVIMVLTGTLLLTGSEALAALTSLFITIPYYALLYLKRDNIKSSFSFHIRK